MKEINNTNLVDIRDRLKKAIAILKGNQIIEKQKDIADSGIIKDTNLSKALKPDIRYLTLSFLEKFCSHYQLINLNWLLTGEGDETNKQPEKCNGSDGNYFHKLSVDDKLNYLYEQNSKLKDENDELKDMVDHLTLTMEISLAPILRHFKLKVDDYEKAKQERSSVN